MKTVEKENYDRLWQSFTERLEEGKKVSQAYPASTKQGKEPTTWFKKKKKKGLRLWQEMNVPAALNYWIDEKIKVSYYTGLLPSSSGGVPESPGIDG